MTNCTLSFEWNTTDFAYGVYTITANAEFDPNENATTNNCTCSIIVTIHGDVDGNFVVNMGDISAVLDAFGSKLGPDGNYWHKPLGLLDPFNPNMDIDGNGAVDMGDITTALDHFGQHYP
jgi:hypothetical protein